MRSSYCKIDFPKLCKYAWKHVTRISCISYPSCRRHIFKFQNLIFSFQDAGIFLYLEFSLRDWFKLERFLINTLLINTLLYTSFF